MGSARFGCECRIKDVQQAGPRASCGLSQIGAASQAEGLHPGLVLNPRDLGSFPDLSCPLGQAGTRLLIEQVESWT